jgi:hypothetical protein
MALALSACSVVRTNAPLGTVQRPGAGGGAGAGTLCQATPATTAATTSAAGHHVRQSALRRRRRRGSPMRRRDPEARRRTGRGPGRPQDGGRRGVVRAPVIVPTLGASTIAHGD